MVIDDDAERLRKTISEDRKNSSTRYDGAVPRKLLPVSTGSSTTLWKNGCVDVNWLYVLCMRSMHIQGGPKKASHY